MDKTYLMAQEKLSKSIVKLSAPAVIGFLVMGLYNMVDTIFLANYDYKAAGATQLILPITMIGGAVGLMLATGAASVISRLLGAENEKKADEIASTLYFTSHAVAIVYVIIVELVLVSVLHMFDAEGMVYDYALTYGRIVSIGLLWQMGTFIFNNTLRAEGNSMYSMTGQAVGSIVNVILDPILIFYFDMGVTGAAIATVISQVIAYIILGQFFLRHKTNTKISWHAVNFSKENYKMVLSIGFPTFAKQIFYSISLVVLNSQCLLYGSSELLSTIGIISKIVMVPSYIIIGIGQGLQPLMGFNYGAGNYHRVNETMKMGIKFSLTIAAVLTAAAYIWGVPIISAFSKDPYVLKYGIIALRWMMIDMIFFAISNNIAVFFQALGEARLSLFVSILRQGIIYLPFIYAIPYFLGIYGVLITQAAASLATLLIAAILIKMYYHKHKYIF